MSQQEIYQIAQQLSKQGKTPSVALIKSRLSVSLPLTEIIKGLRQWQKNPTLGETESVSTTAQDPQSMPTEELTLHQTQQQLADLQQKVETMEQQISQLQQQVISLTPGS